jgi:uncharacterized cupin superfamily protein
MRRANVLRCECAYSESDPEGYRSAMAAIGKPEGDRALAVKVYELPPGQSLCPFHYEYEEEWMLVLEGTVRLRTPAGEEELGRGEMIGFVPGPDGAHKIGNRREEPARVLMFSSAREPAVAVYPDSDKIGAWPGREQDSVMLRRADGHVDYWDGER